MTRRPDARDGAGGLVLAGGAGRRMGGPKALLRLADDDCTLVEHAVGMLARRCRDVLVVARPEIPLPPLAAPVAHDRAGPSGPLTGLATGFAALATERVLVLACDLPFAGPMLDALLAAEHPGAVVGRRAGRIQPLCARYPRRDALAAADRLLAAGELAARGPALELGAAAVDDRWEALLNVNGPADLDRARLRALRAPQAEWSRP